MQKDKLNLTVGQNIRQVRESMGYTRETFSELCDISDSFLSDVERGNKSITTKTLYKICNATHTSADYILFGSIAPADNGNPNMEFAISTLAKLDNNQLSHANHILTEYFMALNDF